eukprot:CAMPEP_0198218634 /NCGR_PEP_ID=MMETSP1445-20131203/70430_1 /TAXON_ID=36898 /ORGANISM="Pyramimonas sp., Strain CCMP2087" /LENGTH=108 /DNA_ID=CAMNT_0043895765 /DNA_START=108 /DNA_END=432 /DNA_ORIENTATION=+
MTIVYTHSDEPQSFVPMDAQYRTSIECQELGVPFISCDLFASEDEEANGTADGDEEGVICSQYQLASQTRHNDASELQWEEITLSRPTTSTATLPTPSSARCLQKEGE